MKKNSVKSKRAATARRKADSPATICSAYSRGLIQKIKEAALKQYPNATSVSHIKPRAYCIAKPAACCVVFVTPPEDAEPQLNRCQNTTAEIISDGNVSKIEVGDWCVLAYICSPGLGMTRVINMPNAEVSNPGVNNQQPTESKTTMKKLKPFKSKSVSRVAASATCYAAAIKKLKERAAQLREAEKQSREDGFWWDARANGEHAMAIETAYAYLQSQAA